LKGLRPGSLSTTSAPQISEEQTPQDHAHEIAEKRRLQCKEWRKRNKERALEYNREWRAKNRQKVNEFNRERGKRLRSDPEKKAKKNRENSVWRNKKYRFDPEHRYASYVNTAKVKGRELTVTRERFFEMFGQECHYCGTKDGDALNGVDRKDNLRGYHEDNVVPCCWRCNRTKAGMGYAEFIGMCNAVASRHSSQ
jgi:hypothetical protein